MDRLSEISLLLANWKSTLAGSAFVADAAAELSNYENIGTKGLLFLAIVYLVKQRESDRLDARTREDKLHSALAANIAAVSALKEETEKQTEYYRDVARTIMDRTIMDRQTGPKSGA
jgi:hypothetical protein